MSKRQIINQPRECMIIMRALLGLKQGYRWHVVTRMWQRCVPELLHYTRECIKYANATYGGAENREKTAAEFAELEAMIFAKFPHAKDDFDDFPLWCYSPQVINSYKASIYIKNQGPAKFKPHTRKHKRYNYPLPLRSGKPPALFVDLK